MVEGVTVSAVHPGVFEVSDGDLRVAAALHRPHGETGRVAPPPVDRRQSLRALLAGPSHRALGERELWAVLDDIEAL